jgi:oxalate---CoA ligase
MLLSNPRPFSNSSCLAGSDDHPIQRLYNKPSWLHGCQLTSIDSGSRSMAIYDLLTRWGHETPDSIAIAAPGRSSLSYAQLWTQIDYVVSQLKSVGVGHDDYVGVLLSDGPEAAVTYVGVACGAICVPLDSRLPGDELERQLSELDTKALVVPSGSHSPATDFARRNGIALLELTGVLDQPAGVLRLNRTAGATNLHNRDEKPADLAFVLRTSGTTERPKLVPLTHANVCASAERLQAALELSTRDRYLNVTRLLYSQGIMLTTASLMAGASVVCPSGFSPADFFGWLDEFRPTWYSAAPAVHQAVLQHVRSRHDFTTRHRFRLIRSAAAPLPTHVREELENVFQAPVVEAYGMTECYPISCNPLWPGTRKPGSAGVSAGTDIAIINEKGEFLSCGATGEVVVRGPHVMRGYLNEGSKGGESFVNGWFKTGDQGYVDSDGFLFLTARLKDIINRGGEKISPAEIDDILMDHPAVAESATFSLPHVTLGEDVAAAIVLRDNATATEREIQAFARSRLAQYKVPRHVVFVPDLPRNANGKVRRSTLAEKFGFTVRHLGSNAEPRAQIAPRSSVEWTLVRIWVQLLGIGLIGIQDNFFDLGGDSLSAVQLMAHIDMVFGRHLSLTAFLQEPTIEQLARAISDEKPDRAWSSLAAIQPHGSRTPFFWVHGDATNAFLATYLGIEQPLYALDHQSQDGQRARYTTVETIAAHYLEEVRSVQSAGPYVLGGFSFGGTLAFEMAQQLRARGDAVDLLVMLDSRFPGTYALEEETSRSVTSLGSSARRHLQHVATLDHQQALAYVTTRVRNRLNQRIAKVKEPFQTLASEAWLRMGRPIPAGLRGHYIRGIYEKALRAYKPLPYGGTVVYVKSEERSNYHRTNWAGVLGEQMESLEVPGNHLNVVVQPYAHMWAGKLREWLETSSACLTDAS